jgi:hypothetical protein
MASAHARCGHTEVSRATAPRLVSVRCVITHLRYSLSHPRIPPQRVAWQLLDAYAACADLSFEKMQESLASGLNSLSGGYAFVLVDRTRHRVVAARDRQGSQPLIWGCATPKHAVQRVRSRILLTA